MNADSILVFNCGSSSLKFGLFSVDHVDRLAQGICDWGNSRQTAELKLSIGDSAECKSSIEVSSHSDAVKKAIQTLQHELVLLGTHFSIVAVGHRVVHGGERFNQSVLIDASVLKGIEDLAVLAPLHNPLALEVIRVAENELPDASHVAVFDTSFFACLPQKSFVYPVPYEWYSDWRIRRFGFHGISHSYCLLRVSEMLDRPPDQLRIITCHLGNGCSATAVVNGQPIKTSMGYTPMDGFMMGTRSGSLDPGILIQVQKKHELGPDQLDRILNRYSGMLGVSGLSADVRELETRAQAGDTRARLALDMFVDQVQQTIGGLFVALGGADVLSFTGGIGENSIILRKAICHGLECLGIYLDENRNENITTDNDIATESSRTRILVIQCQEDAMIAQETKHILEAMHS